MTVLDSLFLWEDAEPRPAPEQMALDEALLLAAARPVLRLYRWVAPAITFGYAQRSSDAFRIAGDLPAVRRWTGGGIVVHGEDLTVCLSLPFPHPACALRPPEIYRLIHSSFLGALKKAHPAARLATPADCRNGPACFVSPALDDLLLDGKKIGGGALRRGKAGVLYQGSLRAEGLDHSSLALSLCHATRDFRPESEVFNLSQLLARKRYTTMEWNKMR